MARELDWHWPPHLVYECRVCHNKITRSDPYEDIPTQCDYCGNRGQSLQHCRRCDRYIPAKYFQEIIEKEGWSCWEWDDVCPICAGYEIPEADVFSRHKYEEDPSDPGRCKVCTEQQNNVLHETSLDHDDEEPPLCDACGEEGDVYWSNTEDTWWCAECEHVVKIEEE